MEDIRVGEYVRTNRGIFKILEIKTVKTKMDGNHDKAYKLDKFKSLWFSKTDFINHSFEPIDLIETGDYVNGHKVYESDDGLVIFNIDDFEYFVNPLDLSLHNYRVVLEWQDENYIKSIVTKEQFEHEKYIVGG